MTCSIDTIRKLLGAFLHHLRGATVNPLRQPVYLRCGAEPEFVFLPEVVLCEEFPEKAGLKRLWGVLGVVVGFLVLGPFILVAALVAFMFGAKGTARKIISGSVNLFYDLGWDLGRGINWLMGEIHGFFYTRWPGATLLLYLISVAAMLVAFGLIVFWHK